MLDDSSFFPDKISKGVRTTLPVCIDIQSAPMKTPPNEVVSGENGKFFSINISKEVGHKSGLRHVFEVQSGTNILKHCVVHHRVGLLPMPKSVAYIECTMYLFGGQGRDINSALIAFS